MSAPRWTPAEDDVIRRAYARREPLARILERLPGRTLVALRIRAARLRCVQKPHWTEEEERTLRLEWGQSFSRRTLREKLPGRTWCAIARHAQSMGLGSPARGLVSVSAAATALGYSTSGLHGVITRQGVTVRRHCGNQSLRDRRYTRLLVDLYDVEQAVARDIAEAARTETLAEAAARHGVSKYVMRRRLAAAGVDVLRRGQPGRLDPRAVDAAMRGERADGMCTAYPAAYARLQVVTVGRARTEVAS